MPIEPWGPGDLELLRRLNGDPVVMQHVGGPETDAKIAERQARYEAEPGCFKIVDGGAGVGWVGFWEREWRGGRVYEAGWSLVPAAQGRGLATAATALLIEEARAAGRCRYLHAFPSVTNPASNAICRKLGFELLETREFEYPPGTFMRCNDWRLDLGAEPRLHGS